MLYDRHCATVLVIPVILMDGVCSRMIKLHSRLSQLALCAVLS